MKKSAKQVTPRTAPRRTPDVLTAYVQTYRSVRSLSPYKLWAFAALRGCKSVWPDLQDRQSQLSITADIAKPMDLFGDTWLNTRMDLATKAVRAQTYRILDALDAEVLIILKEVRKVFAKYEKALHTAGRKAFAAATLDEPHRPALFRLLDGKEILTYAWLLVSPQDYEVRESELVSAENTPASEVAP